jgi:copper resistance protein D
MEAFLSLYGVIDWLLRGVSVAAQTLAIGGVAYILIALPPPESDGSPLEGFSRRLAFWSACVACASQLLAAVALIAFLVGSTGAGIATAAGANAVSFHIVSAGAALALALAARAPRRYEQRWMLPALALLLVGAHLGVTHAASRTELSPSLLAAQLLHLLALATWMGGIPYFIASLRMIRDASERRAVSRRFSVASLASVAVIAATGLFMAIPYAGSLEGLYQTTYGLLLSTKVVLLFMLICLGAFNFLAIRSRRRDKDLIASRVPTIAEVEVGIGLIAILCAVALASSPLASATEAERPTAAEVSARLQPAWPRLASPAYAQISAGQPNAAVTAKESELATRTDADVAWSEAHHHYAALVVVMAGLLALFAHNRRLRPVVQHWPLLLLALAAYLVVTADEEAWPLGKIGFFESLTIPQIAQHKLMIALIAVFAVSEWGVQAKKFKSAWPSYVFPLTIVVAAAFLLTHYGHTGQKEEVLIQLSHAPIALLGVIVASARWLELRLPAPGAARLAGVVWPTAMIAAGAFLLLYRETA